MIGGFDEAINRVFAHEGGFVDHPKDPGGATHYGITHAAYDEWRDFMGEPRRDIRTLTVAEARKIYRVRYWDAVKGDLLPSGVDYCVFDAAVNSGPARAARWLQAAAGAPQDGLIGPQTLAALKGRSTLAVIGAICDARLAFMRSLKTWGTFRNGWERRVADVREAASAMADGASPAPVTAPLPAPAARGDVSIKSAAAALSTSGPAIAAAGGVVSGVAGMASGSGPVQWAIAAVLVVGVLCAAVVVMRRVMSRDAA